MRLSNYDTGVESRDSKTPLLLALKLMEEVEEKRRIDKPRGLGRGRADSMCVAWEGEGASKSRLGLCRWPTGSSSGFRAPDSLGQVER